MMKSKYFIRFIGIALMAVLFLIIGRWVQSSIYMKNRIEEIREGAYNYLEEKYNKEPSYVSEGSYYDSVFFYMAYFEENDPFQVRYIEPALLFEDDYIK